ncbi:hypothetical protein J4E83_004095 [Alternaria metachromatica]|uniref:uncharacterized protein n=1 Tax=Alternaria metachromatica TaxID=283354 RepID=UPI0020C1D74E|nr:uncharacterized protein J4E83_004095 [Alternaria metachromatica]KAI4624421.1 hypothetical protein J4E83_004095 [Alternaria metachromatica]
MANSIGDASDTDINITTLIDILPVAQAHEVAIAKLREDLRAAHQEVNRLNAEVNRLNAENRDQRSTIFTANREIEEYKADDIAKRLKEAEESDTPARLTAADAHQRCADLLGQAIAAEHKLAKAEGECAELRTCVKNLEDQKIEVRGEYEEKLVLSKAEFEKDMRNEYEEKLVLSKAEFEMTMRNEYEAKLVLPNAEFEMTMRNEYEAKLVLPNAESNSEIALTAPVQSVVKKRRLGELEGAEETQNTFTLPKRRKEKIVACVECFRNKTIRHCDNSHTCPACASRGSPCIRMKCNNYDEVSSDRTKCI